MAVLTLDLRDTPLAERHRPIFSAFDALRVGASLELRDVRELDSLQELIEATRPLCFLWQPQPAVAGERCVRIVKTPARSGGGCADCPCQCGGALLERAAD